ncbi:MAG: hypothetical protein HDS51_02490 [Barnesiella sp.]|nr:hypothetical protein [Barnesiella sp.]
MTKLLRNNASASTQGIVFQFLVALEYCFKMNKGDKIYIERFGDITVESEENPSLQIEVKKRKDAITNYSECIWNTIYNWMQPGFDINKYQNLLLITTQSISSSSQWYKWHSLNLEDRLKSLNQLLSKKARAKLSDELNEKINYIQSKLTDKLKIQLVKKIEIIFLAPNFEDWMVRNYPYLNIVPEIQQSNFVYELYGFITLGSQKSDGWEISCEDFVNEKKVIAESLMENTRIFPKIEKTVIDETKFEDKLFVKKILEIEYDEVVPQAIQDYVDSLSYIAELGKTRHKMAEIKKYAQDIKREHDTMYRKAKRNCSEDVIKSSQDFYDEYETSLVQPFSNYNNTPREFRGGITHSLADENQISWHLKNGVDKV